MASPVSLQMPAEQQSEVAACTYEPTTSTSPRNLIVGGVEELQTFLNNFGSELAAENHVSNSVYDPNAPVVYGNAFQENAACATENELRIVEFPSPSASNAVPETDSEANVGQQRVLIIEQSPVLHQNPQYQIFPSVSSTQPCENSLNFTEKPANPSFNFLPQHQHQHQQQILIPVNGNISGQLQGGNTVLLPLIPTQLPNGTIEMRIAASVIQISQEQVDSLNVVQQTGQNSHQQPIILIVGGPANTSVNVQGNASPSSAAINIVNAPRPENGAATKTVFLLTPNTTNVVDGASMAVSESGNAQPPVVYNVGEVHASGGPATVPKKQQRKTHTTTDGEPNCEQKLTALMTKVRGRVVSEMNAIAATKGNVWQCEFCDYTNVKRYLLKRHMKSHSEDRPYMCEVCEGRFKTPNSLQNHALTHSGLRPHQCKTCDASFTTSGEMVRHIRYKHTMEKPHKCQMCDYASVELSKLKRHVRSHTGERPYRCSRCQYATTDQYKLKRHMRSHTGEKPYECEICLQRFTQSNSLKAHRLLHAGKKPAYQCDHCVITCSRKNDLKQHVRKWHTTSDVPLICKKCCAPFPDRYTLKQHTKTHDGEKCFTCDLCNYSCYSQRYLTAHASVHTQDKPFKCLVPNCVSSFRQKSILSRHMTLKHNALQLDQHRLLKRFKCSECPKEFRHKANLQKHEENHRMALGNSEENMGNETDNDEDDEALIDQSFSLDDVDEEDISAEYGVYMTNGKRRKLAANDPYLCPHCGQCFPQHSLLVHHLEMEHLLIDNDLRMAVPEEYGGGDHSYVMGSSSFKTYAFETKPTPDADTKKKRRPQSVRPEQLGLTSVRLLGRPAKKEVQSACSSRMNNGTESAVSSIADHQDKDLDDCFGFETIPENDEVEEAANRGVEVAVDTQDLE